MSEQEGVPTEETQRVDETQHTHLHTEETTTQQEEGTQSEDQGEVESSDLGEE